MMITQHGFAANVPSIEAIPIDVLYLLTMKISAVGVNN